MDLVKMINPESIHVIELDGIKFHLHNMTNATKLRLAGSLGDLTIGTGDFEAMMNLVADLMVHIDLPGYEFGGNESPHLKTFTALPQDLMHTPDGEPNPVADPRPADGLTARQFINRIDDVEFQYNLYKAVANMAELDLDFLEG